MKVAVIGVTGKMGSRIAAELLARGHVVTGIVRNAATPAPDGRIALKAADATDPAALGAALAGQDAVISCSRFRSSDPAALLAGVKSAGVARLLVVGGASSLEVAPGQILFDTPDFPEAYRPEAGAGRAFFAVLKQEKDLDWTFLSPSAETNPGVRTGKFRLGKDQLLVDEKGESWISMEDYAIAMVDELEQPQHSRTRFTVGY